MQPTPNLPDRRPPRCRAIGRSAAALLVATLIGPAAGVATARQAPVPEPPAAPPPTPIQLWETVNFLIGGGRFVEAAAQIERLVESNPDDATLLAIRDRFGIGMVLQLEENPETAEAAGALLDRIEAAESRLAPGLESFATQPETPLELWDAVSYLTRVGRYDQAAPLVDRFLQSNPDDATLLEIRSRFGLGSVLRLQDDPRTAAAVGPLIDLIRGAADRNARRADLIRRSIARLTGTPLERSEALRRLRSSGPYAVPELLRAIAAAEPGSIERQLLISGLGELEPRAVPAVLGALESPDADLAAAAARALGMIGDRRALPFLVAEAAGAADGREAARDAARKAIGALGRDADRLLERPARVLLDEAERYFTGAYEFPGQQVELWGWDEAAGTVAPRLVRPAEAEALLGDRFVRKALELAPEDREAVALRVALEVREALQVAGPDAGMPPGGLPEGLGDEVTGASAEVLADALAMALDAGNGPEAAALASLYGRAIDPSALELDRPSLLLRALESPDRRVEFAAARALVELEPARPFFGSSRVVPILSRFLRSEVVPRAVVIDGAVHRGAELASLLRSLNFDVDATDDARDGFRLATATADVELVFVAPSGLLGGWELADLLANLRGDSRTRGLPVLLYGESAATGRRLAFYPEDDPLIEYLVIPPVPWALARQLDRITDRMGDRPLTPEERGRYAAEAAGLLARIAEKPIDAYTIDLAMAGDPLIHSLFNPALAESAAAALAIVPTAAAQRELADVALDGSRRPELRTVAADRLVVSVGRFGPLLDLRQRDRLPRAIAREADPAIRADLEAVAEAIRRSGAVPAAPAVTPRSFSTPEIFGD